MNYIIIIILLALSATFSASETTFACVNKIRLKAASDQGDRSAGKALKLADNYSNVLTAILIGNNIVNNLMASLSTVIATSLFGNGGVAIATAVITVIIIIFGEIMPKSYAKIQPEKCSRFFATPLTIWTVLMTPFVKIFNLLSGIFKKDDSPSVTEDELKYMIDEIEDQGVLEKSEGNLVRHSLDFDETPVLEICIPRVHVVAIEKNTSVAEIKKVFLNCPYSRLPVYDGDMDNIIGVLNYKDFFRMLNDGKSDITEYLQDIIRISELQMISEAFRQMQKGRIHFAVVLDQYGGTRGIITLEDIIEEIVGEIYDESDPQIPEMIKLRDNMYRVSGSMRTADLFEKLGIDPEKNLHTNAVSIGGYIIDKLGHIPKYGETLRTGHLRFRVLEVSDTSVKTILVKKDPPTENTVQK